MPIAIPRIYHLWKLCGYEISCILVGPRHELVLWVHIDACPAAERECFIASRWSSEKDVVDDGRYRKISVYVCLRLRRIGVEGNVEAISFLRQPDVIRPPPGDGRSLDENGECNLQVLTEEKETKKESKSKEKLVPPSIAGRTRSHSRLAADEEEAVSGDNLTKAQQWAFITTIVSQCKQPYKAP
jgi:hypothetical protein